MRWVIVSNFVGAVKLRLLESCAGIFGMVFHVRSIA